MTIDFDAPHLSSSTGVKWWLAGFGFFASLMGFVGVMWDPASRKATSTRHLPYNGLEKELGGRPAN